MENQHRHIAGYRDLSRDEIEFINELKSQGEKLGQLFEFLEQAPEIDKRWLAIAKTDIQRGFMALVRAVARPTTFV